MRLLVMNRFIKFSGQFSVILSKSLFVDHFDIFIHHRFFRLVKNQIDDILSHEKILTYLSNLRTKVLWPDDQNTSIPMKNIKHRAYNAIITKIPSRRFSMVFLYFIL